MPFEPSSKFCSNPEVCAVLDRIGAFLEQAGDYEEKRARAETLTSEWAAQAAATAAAAKPRQAVDVRFRASVEGVTDTRELAKRTAPFFVGSVDGKTIERLSSILRRTHPEAFAAVGAELAREIAARPEAFGNPLSVLDWRLRKAAGGAP